MLLMRDESANVIETHEHAGESKGPYAFRRITSHLTLKNEISMDPAEILSTAERGVPVTRTGGLRV
jgi:hypothetical protein